MPGAIHHAVIAVTDLELSLRFYRDGLGLDLLFDRDVEGDWPQLLGAPSRSLRAVFLGDQRFPDDHSGVLELNLFEHDIPLTATPPPAVGAGLYLLSFFVDVEATLSRLAALQLGGPPRASTRPGTNGPITLATVRDPDGVTVLLVPGSITQTT